MKRWFSTQRIIGVFATLTLLLHTQAAANVLVDIESEIQSIYDTHSNSIVRVKIATQNTKAEGDSKTSLTVFSGFFVSEDGKVLTNATTSEGTTRVWIEKNGLSYLADVIGSDEKSNLSLLQILNIPKDISYIEIDESVKHPQIGSFAIAITSPLEFAPSPSFGLITGYESNFSDFTFPFTYTRASIAIGPAEGGSPIFNAEGQFVGVNTASMPEVRSSYSIPPVPLNKIISDFIQYGKVNYSTLPFTMKEGSGPYNQERKVIINEFDENSSITEAGLKSGDTILEINDILIKSINHARDTIFQQNPGAFLKLKIQRENTILDFAIPLELEVDAP